MSKIKQIIKKITPPIVVDLFKKPTKYGFFGDYTDWEKAVADSSGYDSPVIFEKVKTSAMKVKQGLVAFERDGVTFDTKQTSWPVATMLLLSASYNDNNLNVLDFGGSLGSSYFQNIEFIKHLRELHWAIVEQKNIYEYGKQYFEDEHLSFYKSLEEALNKVKPQVFLAGSAIQYIEKPYELLGQIIGNDFESIIFDRTLFFNGKEVLTVQKVPPRIYDASYPAWILDIDKFKEFFKKNGYGIIAECDYGTMAHDSKENAVFLKHITFSKK